MSTLGRYRTKDNLTVPRYAIERAVLNLGKMEALALIRASFREKDDRYATLDNAKIIYSLILKDHDILEDA